MDILIFVKAFILGIIEGLTEFLPVSSTGHLIVFSDLLHFHSNGKVFEIVIQLGAVLAVLFEYRQRFTHVITHIGREPATNRFIVNLIIAFLPAAIIGVLLIKYIKEVLFNPISVASALVIGGLIIMWAEKRQRHHTPRVTSVDDMTAKDALIVGLAQVLSLIPGTSRSGSTIIGGMLGGLSRKAATEFTFFLAVPVMFAATFYDVLKHYHDFSMQDGLLIAVGFIAAFFSALIAIKGLLRYVAGNTFIPFAWYRILFGGVILLTWLTGVVQW